MILSMERHASYPMLFSMIALSVMFFNCEGPEGPAGTDGTDGTDGIAGVDANETCKVCHNDGGMLTGIQAQYAVSGHATGGTANYGNQEGECSECHTSQGFVYYQANGVSSPTHFASVSQPDCRACHMIHTEYDSTDWAFRVTDPVVSFRDATQTFADFGTANLCVACHQTRSSALPALDATADVSVDTKRFGPHHAPQGNFMDNSAGQQFTGVAYTPSVHTVVADGCVTCHMADGGHYPYGGHTFSMTASFHGPQFNDTACDVVGCHAGADVKALITATKADIAPLLTELKAALGDYLDTSGYLAERTIVGTDTTYTSPTEDDPIDFDPVVLGAVYNYRMIAFEDPGYAVHNPKLARALLQNSIDALP